MRNLAGRADCDLYIREELERARIPAVEIQRLDTEVPYAVVGQLGELTFRRGWRYWVVNGPVPIEVAEELYKDPVGKTDIRVAGNAGSPPPAEWAKERHGMKYVDSYHIDSEVGLRIFADAIKSQITVQA